MYWRSKVYEHYKNRASYGSTFRIVIAVLIIQWQFPDQKSTWLIRPVRSWQVNPLSGKSLVNLFSPHPPIAQRVALLNQMEISS